MPTRTSKEEMRKKKKIQPPDSELLDKITSPASCVKFKARNRVTRITCPAICPPQMELYFLFLPVEKVVKFGNGLKRIRACLCLWTTQRKTQIDII